MPFNLEDLFGDLLPGDNIGSMFGIGNTYDIGDPTKGYGGADMDQQLKDKIREDYIREKGWENKKMTKRRKRKADEYADDMFSWRKSQGTLYGSDMHNNLISQNKNSLIEDYMSSDFLQGGVQDIARQLGEDKSNEMSERDPFDIASYTVSPNQGFDLSFQNGGFINSWLGVNGLSLKHDNPDFSVMPKLSIDGYRKGSKDRKEKAVMIPGNLITFKDMDVDAVLMVPENGEPVIARKGDDDAYFPDSRYVIEYPLNDTDDYKEAKKKGMNMPEFMQRQMYKTGGIHIKKANRGKFTESANRAGMGVQEYARHILANKENYSSTQVKRANFARNAAKWKHQLGGYPMPPQMQSDNTFVQPVPFMQPPAQGVPVEQQQAPQEYTRDFAVTDDNRDTGAQYYDPETNRQGKRKWIDRELALDIGANILEGAYEGTKGMMNRFMPFSGDLVLGLPEEILRSQMQKNIVPYGYADASKRIGQFVRGETPENRNSYDAPHIRKVREDSWRLYLGYPPKHNDTYAEARYEPSQSDDRFLAKAFGTNKRKIVRPADPNWVRSIEDGVAKAAANGSALPIYDRYSMGYYKWGIGNDDKGKYISYYDKWDFLGAPGGIGPGEAFDAYDRYYEEDIVKMLQERGHSVKDAKKMWDNMSKGMKGYKEDFAAYDKRNRRPTGFFQMLRFKGYKDDGAFDYKPWDEVIDDLTGNKGGYNKVLKATGLSKKAAEKQLESGNITNERLREYVGKAVKNFGMAVDQVGERITKLPADMVNKIASGKAFSEAGDSWEYRRTDSGWQTRKKGNKKWITAQGKAASAIEKQYGMQKKQYGGNILYGQFGLNPNSFNQQTVFMGNNTPRGMGLLQWLNQVSQPPAAQFTPYMQQMYNPGSLMRGFNPYQGIMPQVDYSNIGPTEEQREQVRAMQENPYTVNDPNGVVDQELNTRMRPVDRQRQRADARITYVRPEMPERQKIELNVPEQTPIQELGLNGYERLAMQGEQGNDVYDPVPVVPEEKIYTQAGDRYKYKKVGNDWMYMKPDGKKWVKATGNNKLHIQSVFDKDNLTDAQKKKVYELNQKANPDRNKALGIGLGNEKEKEAVPKEEQNLFGGRAWKYEIQDFFNSIGDAFRGERTPEEEAERRKYIKPYEHKKGKGQKGFPGFNNQYGGPVQYKHGGYISPNNVMGLYQMGGQIQYAPAQLEVGEKVIMPNGEMVNSKARLRHSQMDPSEITDYLPAAPQQPMMQMGGMAQGLGSGAAYVLSRDPAMKVKKKMADKFVARPKGPFVYEENELNPVEDEETMAMFYGNKSAMTPAQFGGVIQRKMPSFKKTKQVEKPDLFQERASNSNIEARKPYYDQLVNMSEVMRMNVEGQQQPQQYQFGAAVQGLTSLIDMAGNIFGFSPEAKAQKRADQYYADTMRDIGEYKTTGNQLINQTDMVNKASRIGTLAMGPLKKETTDFDPVTQNTRNVFGQARDNLNMLTQTQNQQARGQFNSMARNVDDPAAASKMYSDFLKAQSQTSGANMGAMIDLSARESQAMNPILLQQQMNRADIGNQNREYAQMHGREFIQGSAADQATTNANLMSHFGNVLTAGMGARNQNAGFTNEMAMQKSYGNKLAAHNLGQALNDMSDEGGWLEGLFG